MSRVKKISEEQFTLDVINKEFEIAGSTLYFDTFEELKQYATENPRWYDKLIFKTVDQYLEWKSFYIDNYSRCYGRASRAYINSTFQYFALNFGPRCEFDYKEIK